ncbi:unnamed protein product [Prorocentrum cordatum]|uniref:RING-type domain-containing protein n=1 Tax=Prorocentrum cordatum TaxID=2364126 RepID=A0ABN9RUG9_9DINO|nr:unnamed protein product [Polarella glacialis]
MAPGGAAARAAAEARRGAEGPRRTAARRAWGLDDDGDACCAGISYSSLRILRLGPAAWAAAPTPPPRGGAELGGVALAASLSHEAAFGLLRRRLELVGRGALLAWRAHSWAAARSRAWLSELKGLCRAAAGRGALGCRWSSGELWGCGPAGWRGALLRCFAAGLADLRFARVEWWGDAGWTSRPRCCPPCGAGAGPRRSFGAQGFAVCVAVAWGAAQLGAGPPRAESCAAPLASAAQRGACPVCWDRSARRARLEPCGHQLCRLCARRLKGNRAPPAARCAGAPRTWNDGALRAAASPARAASPGGEEPPCPLAWGELGEPLYGLRPFLREPAA